MNRRYQGFGVGLLGGALVVLGVLPGGAIAQEEAPTRRGRGEQLAQFLPPPPTQAPAQPQQTPQQPDVLVPNPQVTIDGVPVTTPAPVQVVPPFLPRAVAPPVGDIVLSETRPQFGAVNLGTSERVPRLVLRNAPAREVLALLARAAGLNLVFVGGVGGSAGDVTGGAGAAAPAPTAQGEGASEGPFVTMDIQNESVQDAFNSVLQVTGLQANRVGRTIYVGARLPASAQDVSVRSLRLNQLSVPEAVNFLVALGAESAISRERLVTSVNAVPVGEGAPPITQTQTSTVQQVEVQRVNYRDVNPVFRGLQVVGEERTNSITLVGNPQLIQMATEQLVRLDLRRRQVAINVRVIDINLDTLDQFGTSFSFALGGSQFVNTAGFGVINFGNNSPGSVAPGAFIQPPQTPFGGAGSPQGVPNIVNPTPFGIFNGLLAQITALIRNGNAKILTDPTLVVQEGQEASISLTTEVVTNRTLETVTTVAGARDVFNIEKEDAGLVLSVEVSRIDDNGFVGLSVAPSISAPAGIFETGVGPAVLLAKRQLSSGQIRVRDGQTLLLSGIIQETDRVDTTRIPILGDLPIIGALFRSTSRVNERAEVVILLTPNILDDSDQSVWGYSYTPSEEVQELLQRSPQSPQR